MTDMTQAPTPGPLSGDWPVVTDKWVETYCDLTGRDPDGGSVTFLGDGPVSTSFRDAARREIEAMLCAAPKSAIRSLAPTAPVETLGHAAAFAANIDTAPVEASGSEREADAWKWLGQLYPNDAPSDLAYDANEMVDAFLAGSGRSDRMAKALERIADEQQYRSGYCQTDITVEPALTAEEAQTVAREALAQQTAPRPQPSGETREAEQMALNIICDPGIITGLHTAAEARDWIEKSVRAALLSKKKPTSEEVDARRRLINLIEQWDGESEYDAEDCASLADDILHAFNGSPVLSSSALGYVSADAEAALKAGINRVIYPAPSAHASFPLYAAPVPAQDDDKLRIAIEALAKWEEFNAYRKSDPLALRFEFETEEDRLAAANALDEVFASLKSTAAQEGGSK